jgi:hypothetical protein
MLARTRSCVFLSVCVYVLARWRGLWRGGSSSCVWAVAFSLPCLLCRQTFWETNPKLGGRLQVWEALKIATDAFLQADIDLCNTILEVRVRAMCCVVVCVGVRVVCCSPSACGAARVALPRSLSCAAQASDIRTPNGTLEVCYDSSGVMYQIPPYVFSAPGNLMSDAEAATRKRAAPSGPVVDIPIIVRLSATVRWRCVLCRGGPLPDAVAALAAACAEQDNRGGRRPCHKVQPNSETDQGAAAQFVAFGMSVSCCRGPRPPATLSLSLLLSSLRAQSRSAPQPPFHLRCRDCYERYVAHRASMT